MENTRQLSKEEIDLIFTKEIHTGERVRADVQDALKEVDPAFYEGRIRIASSTAQQTLMVYAGMLERLPTNERMAFEYVLAKRFEDFCYTHYSALRHVLEEQQVLKSA